MLFSDYLWIPINSSKGLIGHYWRRKTWSFCLMMCPFFFCIICISGGYQFLPLGVYLVFTLTYLRNLQRSSYQNLTKVF